VTTLFNLFLLFIYNVTQRHVLVFMYMRDMFKSFIIAYFMA